MLVPDIPVCYHYHILSVMADSATRISNEQGGYLRLEMAEIQLTQGQTAIIDDEDIALTRKYKWCVQKVKSGDYYAITNYRDENGKKARLYLHRLLMNPPEGLVVDHKDGNTLDNRRSNLRVCTHSQNLAAGRITGKRKSYTQYRGVTYQPKGKRHWQASIKNGGKYKYLGVFDTELEAAHARDEAALELLGEFAVLNLPPAGLN
jgi:hypothetical protein